MKVFIHVNTFAGINPFVYSNHIACFLHTRKVMPELEMILFTPHRSSIDRMRNQGAIHAMQLECDYLWFLDDDVLIPPDTLVKLIANKQDICAATVVIRGMPFNLMAFQHVTPEEAAKGKSGYYNEVVKKGELEGKPVQSVDGVGFSCCLIDIDVIKAMEPPYFITGPQHTEDTFFCNKAQSTLEPTPKISVDTSIRCGHLMGAEPIEYDTIPLFTEFYKKINGMNGIAPERFNRDEEYIRRTLNSLPGVEVKNEA